MAQIRARRQADGSTRYTAIIRIRKGTTLIQQEYRTFTQRSAAASWAKHREVHPENEAVPGRRQHDPITLAALIRWYIETFETISKWQRSKQSHLEFLERHAIGKVNALELTAAALIGHVRRRRADGAGPATVMSDLVWIGVVLRAASNVKEVPVRPEVAQEAREACATLRLIGKARKRARRPTPQELAQLRDYFAARDRRADIPMLAIMIVHPDHQGQGLGSELLKRAEVALREVSIFELFTGTKSEANIRLYQRHGYRISRTQELSPTVSITFMQKSAPNPQ
jgi:GNAT superfamily N-acetyltransferase